MALSATTVADCSAIDVTVVAGSDAGVLDVLEESVVLVVVVDVCVDVDYEPIFVTR